jgi:hypothetical protein
MDAERFDRITRTVAASANRRTLLRSGMAGAMALLGMRAIREQAVAADDGYEGAICSTSDDCRTGLVCQGSSRGLLGGSLAGTPYGPGVSIPLIEGKEGRCRYHSGDNCGKEGQSCESNSDCCNNLGLTCRSKKCRR